MADRGDEIKGGLKQGLGKLTGNARLETEGATQQQRGRIRRKVSGSLREARGGLKQAAGDVLDSPTLRAEGLADRLAGKIEQE